MRRAAATLGGEAQTRWCYVVLSPRQGAGFKGITDGDDEDGKPRRRISGAKRLERFLLAQNNKVREKQPKQNPVLRTSQGFQQLSSDLEHAAQSRRQAIH